MTNVLFRIIAKLYRIMAKKITQFLFYIYYKYDAKFYFREF